MLFYVTVAKCWQHVKLYVKTEKEKLIGERSVKFLRIGYACLALGVPDTAMKHCLLKNATEAQLSALIAKNLKSLRNLVDYNIVNGIKLFRISSDLIPFGSSPVNTLRWETIYASEFHRIGKAIKESGMRVSLHPGQYTVLNSPNDEVVARAILDLEYHASVLSALGTNMEHKIILHIGGVYGDKEAATARFVARFKQLSDHVKNRLVIENDDKSYAVDDVLAISKKTGIPVVFDLLHHQVKPPASEKTALEWLDLCAGTWREKDGRQKIHYAQQHPQKKRGSHADTVNLDAFLPFYHSLGNRDLDIMLEVKDKNLSAVKCIHCVTAGLPVKTLEKEWSKYKYTVLEKSPAAYEAIRKLLKDKNAYPALAFYRHVEEAMAAPEDRGHAINAMEHVWGYFKKTADVQEKEKFKKTMARYQRGELKLTATKKHLLKLAEKYDQRYLLDSYYFVL